MQIANIVVPLQGDEADAQALAAAFAAATPFGAHVEGLFAPDHIRAEARERARIAFLEQAGRAGADVKAAPRPAGTLTAAYREAEDAQALARIEAFADLIVLPHGAARDRGDFIRILMESGRPVLLAAATPRPVARLAICWDGGLAAARALAAALPFAATTHSVEILTVGAPGGIAAGAAADYLALHGVTASVRTLAQGTAPTGATLLREDADLLVLGGYGHSRLVESVFGGTTRHILDRAPSAILMTH